MNTVSVQDIINLIAEALELQPSSITPASTQDDVEEWDSLGHIAVLSVLDDSFDNITERVPELIDTTTISEIVEILKSQGFVN